MESKPAFAYLTDDRIHVSADGSARTFKSKFGEEMLDRAARIGRKNAWKTQGSGARFMFGRPADPEEMAVAPARLTALAAGERGLIYSLETDSVSALLALDAEGGEEKRLFHSNEIRLDSIAPAPDGKTVACSVRNTYGVLDLALLDVERGGLQELTEGDSADSHPSYRSDREAQLVFQSAGLARDEEGWVIDRGPSTIECLDLDRGNMETLAEEADRDLLVPRVDESGRLFYIRRPYRGSKGPNPLETLKAILLFPFHFVLALFHLVSTLTAFLSRKPLMEGLAGKARRKGDAKERIQILGEMVEIEERKKRQHASQDDDAPLVPDSWQLVRRDADRTDGEPEVLASGVVSFDLLADGTVLYSNGRAIFHLDASGKKQRLGRDRRIRHVVGLSD